VKKPIIGITMSQKITAIKTDALSSAYSNAVIRAGGLPILIPNTFPVEHIKRLLEKLDGIILSGGGDVAHHLFNGEPHAEIGNVSQDRDSIEVNLVKLALNKHFPIFGICRGIQVINIAMGGTLFTHIPAQYKTTIDHNSPDIKGRDFLAHEVNINPESELFRAMETKNIRVNSFHHQAIKDLAPGLVVTATASDGLIEGVELIDCAFPFFGVQWHPECLPDLREQRNLFSAFIAKCER
jgi:putative glutamine amidotransferase